MQFLAPRRVAVVPIKLPQPVPDGQLLIRTRYSGISAGTELLAYRGELAPSLAMDEALAALSGRFQYPFAYGYSCVGYVEVGTTAIPAGTAVFAFHPHQDLFLVPESDVVPLDQAADLRLATMFPLVETALQLTLDAGSVIDETVVVLGLGAVGLLTAILLTRGGAHVLAAEPRDWRREIAASSGITAVTPEELAARVADVTDGKGTHLLVELSGAPSALADGLALLAHEGTALVGSWYGIKPVPLPLGADFHRRRLTLRSSQVSTIPATLQGRWDVPKRRRAALNLLGDLPLRVLATTEYAFASAPDAYVALDKGATGVMHVSLRYE